MPSKGFWRCVRWIGIGMLALLLAALFLLLSPLAWPLKAPKVTLTNGHQTVVFEGMIHVGSRAFYQSVVADVAAQKRAGAVYWMEGVRLDPDTPASRQRARVLTMLITGEPNSHINDLYDQVAQLTGLIAEPQAWFAALPGPHPDWNADITTDLLLSRIQHLPHPPALPTHDDVPILMAWIHRIQTWPRGIQPLVAFVGRMLLVLDIRVDRWIPDPLTPAVLDFRNQYLADHIASGPKHLVITFGADHIPGVLQDLRRHDPSWHETSQCWRNVFAVSHPACY